MILSLLGLGLLILIHEWGHFWMARRCGMAVKRFSIGFGKPILSRQVGETVFQLALLPWGGFVEIKGMIRDGTFADDDPSAFCNGSIRSRMAVIALGPAINYVFGLLLLATLCYAGFPVPTQRSILADPSAGMPAAAAGLQAGDRVISIDARPVETRWVNLVEAIQASRGKPMDFVVQRGAERIQVRVTAQPSPDGKRWLIGVSQGNEVHREASPGQSLAYAFDCANQEAVKTLKALASLFSPSQSKAGFSGPVGIVRSGASAVREGLASLATFLSVLSINVAIFNLLPWPALDGGRLVMLAVEALRGRPPSPRSEILISALGMAALLALLLVGTVQDFLR